MLTSLRRLSTNEAIGWKDLHEILYWRGVIVTPVEAMKAYRGRIGISPLLNLVNRWKLWATCPGLFAFEKLSVPVEVDAGWAPETECFGEQKNLPLHRIDILIAQLEA